MPELHELLGRELDPIDDVRRRFEDVYFDDYFDPYNGDHISDDYYQTIDLTTSPHRLSQRDVRWLNRSILHLNDVSEYIAQLLGGSSLLDAYNDVAQQINGINSADPNRGNVPTMQSAPVEVAA